MLPILAGITIIAISGFAQNAQAQGGIFVDNVVISGDNLMTKSIPITNPQLPITISIANSTHNIVAILSISSDMNHQIIIKSGMTDLKIVPEVGAFQYQSNLGSSYMMLTSQNSVIQVSGNPAGLNNDGGVLVLEVTDNSGYDLAVFAIPQQQTASVDSNRGAAEPIFISYFKSNVTSSGLPPDRKTNYLLSASEAEVALSEGKVKTASQIINNATLQFLSEEKNYSQADIVLANAKQDLNSAVVDDAKKSQANADLQFGQQMLEAGNYQTAISYGNAVENIVGQSKDYVNAQQTLQEVQTQEQAENLDQQELDRVNSDVNCSKKWLDIGYYNESLSCSQDALQIIKSSFLNRILTYVGWSLVIVPFVIVALLFVKRRNRALQNKIRYKRRMEEDELW